MKNYDFNKKDKRLISHIHKWSNSCDGNMVELSNKLSNTNKYIQSIKGMVSPKKYKAFNETFKKEYPRGDFFTNIQK